MMRSLPILTSSPNRATSPPHFPELLVELQTYGLRFIASDGPGLSRRGGAGPSDHKAVTLGGETIMVPIFSQAALTSPFSVEASAAAEKAVLHRHGKPVAELTFPRPPRFYERHTEAGVPYWKIATLHGRDVLATTVLQTCIRYGNRQTACQFCAIGRSLASKVTIAEKTPAQLAEVAKAAVELDGVRHAVLTTGTPHTPDRGAAVLAAASEAIKRATSLPIQVQCEPPDDHAWFARLEASGVDSLGMHLEAVSEPVRQRIMPGKAETPVSEYFRAFAAAVAVFGRGQVSTYILAGLGDSRDAIVGTCGTLLELGVYPFVVPFVPIAGTPLENRPAPSAAFMQHLLDDVSALIAAAGMRSTDVKAGCARCGACSSLKAREAHA